MPTSRLVRELDPAPKVADPVAALRFAVGLPQPVCEDALRRCRGDVIKAEAMLRAATTRYARAVMTSDA